ncbi:ribonucleoside-diphosphate reductase class Ib glutaredoxin subunit [Arthrobacter alpinus]|uniref:Ribonucleoside-diphosphate reductase class Ib glutaredoxin subunit n=1 Tax=Arthrobacter alpinus TaxID=656366 RepID=A0A1H5M2H7_9MICC|nr:glutaredoxin domain-containing protein [Arthrobacter alpinus]SEE83360.1 ribonucleoside-diphosphate reductase class Ib glutaredoxin subunit [Arthrobacter alpinus]
MTTPTLYSKPACVQCTMTKKWLDRNGTVLPIVDVTVDTDALAKIVALNYAQAPVIWIDADTHWSGFRPDLLAQHFPKENAS